MLKLFKPKYHSVLGIDISSTAVNAVEISGRDENRCIEGYGSVTLPGNAVEGHVIKDVNAVTGAIEELLLANHLKSKFAVVALPDSAVISKILQVNDFLSESEIEEFIIMEADKYIPYPIEEINIDFEIIGPSVKNPSMLDVLIVASRAENVTSRLEALTKAGLQVSVVDVESFAMERAVKLLAGELPASGLEKVVAIMDIGEEFSSIFVLQNMKLIYTHAEEFGVKQLVESIAVYYGITHAEALQLKDKEKKPADYLTGVINPFMDMILLQIKRSLQFFFSASQYGFIDYILMAGSVTHLPSLAALVQEKTKIPTSIANPFKHFELSSRINPAVLEKRAPSLLIACGLAMRNIG